MVAFCEQSKFEERSCMRAFIPRIAKYAGVMEFLYLIRLDSNKIIIYRPI